ncbi:unnamed protein product [Lathyrus oleraceus]
MASFSCLAPEKWQVDFAEIHLVYILLYKIKINWPHYFVSRMFAIKECNKGTSFGYVSMIIKILNYFEIAMPNLTYKSSGPTQDFSQRTLTNLGYFWNINRRAYYFRTSKNGRKIYNFDDLAKFGDDVVDAHMDDEQLMGVPHDVLEGDAVMQDALHGDAHGSAFGTGFGDTSPHHINAPEYAVKVRQEACRRLSKTRCL